MISPVIFFTLVIGVIEGFQYFTEAYVANITASNGDVERPRSSAQSMLFFTTRLYQVGLDPLPDGLRVGARVGAARHHADLHARSILKTSRRWVFYQGGESR